jgi:hypothetical protein
MHLRYSIKPPKLVQAILDNPEWTPGSDEYDPVRLSQVIETWDILRKNQGMKHGHNPSRPILNLLFRKI